MPELRAAIIQDGDTGNVLMLGWMDADAERLTRETGDVHFYSRSRKQLWRKGETSGNSLAVESIEADCDGDALLVRVRPTGPTCHLGTQSCFTPWLWRRIVERSAADPAESYVARELALGPSGIARKLGEEAFETAVAAVAEGDDRLVSEAGDLWFHLLLLLRSRGIDIDQLEAELRSRDRGR